MNRWAIDNAIAGLVLGTLVMASPPVAALDCPANLTRVVVNDDINVRGDCTLRGVTVNGSVNVTGGRLISRHGTIVVGSVKVENAGDITLSDTEVLGSVELVNSGTLTVTDSKMESITLRRSGDVNVNGSDVGDLLMDYSGAVRVVGDLLSPSSLTAIYSIASKSISLDHTRIFPGGVSTTLADGGVEICSSEIGLSSADGTHGTGGVSVTASLGDVLVDASGCGPSQIEGNVLVEKGDGNVRLSSATLDGGDLIVAHQFGNVFVENSSLIAIRLERNTGATTLNGVVTDGNTTVAENSGDVSITGSALSSNILIKSNRAVTVTGNEFRMEDVSIVHNSGPVVIDSNSDRQIAVGGNEEVGSPSDNEFTLAKPTERATAPDA